MAPCYWQSSRQFATKPKENLFGGMPDLSAAQTSSDNLPDFLQTSSDPVDSAFNAEQPEDLKQLSDEQKREVPGLLEYELALQFEQDGSYDEAEMALKEALKQVKNAGE